jgi:hypothetical protein
MSQKLCYNITVVIVMGNESNNMIESDMSNKSDKTSYETPVIIPLGELVRGSGNCSNGTNPTTAGGGNCNEGGLAQGSGGNCIGGSTPARNCNTGGNK